MGFQRTRRSIADLCFCGALLLSGCFVSDRTPPQVANASTKSDSGTPADAGPGECSTDPQSGECTRDQAVFSCGDGGCVIVRCLAAYADCDFDSGNGCESALDTPDNCGLCGAVCRYDHAAGTCDARVCKLDHCTEHFGDCDGLDDNGCETSLTTLSDCGKCGKSCPTSADAVAECEQSQCRIAKCANGRGDCNHTFNDGCEQALDTAAHCGACGEDCSRPNARGSCDAGRCLITMCNPGWADCNGVVEDGCEADLSSPAHCGACSTKCSLSHVSSYTCTKENDRAICAIDHRCTDGTPNCMARDLSNGCSDGYADCDGNATNGCETNLSSLNNCGGCGRSCVKPNTLTECSAGACRDVGCAPGFALCGAARCSSVASDPRNCGACGKTCSGEASQCSGGRCTSQLCSQGQADCDGNASNGCETALTAANSCGVCGHSCAGLPRATGACRDGTCVVASCNPGFADCDGEPNNGCETDLHTIDNCGACHRPCAYGNAVTDCSTGECRITSCESLRADCNSNVLDGCEADLQLPAHCGSCGNSCSALANAISSSCTPDGCSIACSSGRADCNSSAADGCEADLADAHSCGSCGNDCSKLANVSRAVCRSGSCRDLVCAADFADCNRDPLDGCETSLRAATDCGACGRVCASPHAAAGDCSSGTCEMGACDKGFADCNSMAADGCEQSLSAPEHCGSCTNACRTGATCVNGACSCSRDEDCGAGGICCSGRCGSNDTACFIWPCIPGTDRPHENCGGCDMVCQLWCCTGNQTEM